ncbi:hypothetical protein ASPZODRAFT_13338 [Penicilliopsis zonata CBS 506.65]|uniref:RING-type domain-containing protein n=1 Tax=Penicilliopsis zonata CBS 506.65 TaxID=1073090 RepID=A0A1L9ST18_9EURO|nr:hypothetical protein ASPZODRAFT_13338 [Penicilliopsis zonata CBS 506.65]OJJ50251.1 hypothetical protein ASPZODRAFT_13338 [Penicilliopsis zonata CBS 506.65]
MPHSLPEASQWRVWKSVEIFFTLLLNSQLRRRWRIECEWEEHESLLHRTYRRPMILLESIPTFSRWSGKSQELETLKQRVRVIRARAEKERELVAEILQRALESGTMPGTTPTPMTPTLTAGCPTDFCHTCICSGDVAAIFLTRCGHRVCCSCLAYSVLPTGEYVCGICLEPTELASSRRMSHVSRSSLFSTSTTTTSATEIDDEESDNTDSSSIEGYSWKPRGLSISQH